MNRAGLNIGWLGSEELAALGLGAVGENVRIHRLAIIANCAAIRIGSNVRIDAFAVLSAGRSISIGSNVHIGTHCGLFGSAPITLEDFSGLSHGVRVYSATDNYDGAALTNPTVPDRYRDVRAEPVVIGRHAIIGSGAVILPGVMVGEGAAVGALSLVTNSLEGWAIYAGAPARRLRARGHGLLDLERVYVEGPADPAA